MALTIQNTNLVVCLILGWKGKHGSGPAILDFLFSERRKSLPNRLKYTPCFTVLWWQTLPHFPFLPLRAVLFPEVKSWSPKHNHWVCFSDIIYLECIFLFFSGTDLLGCLDRQVAKLSASLEQSHKEAHDCPTASLSLTLTSLRSKLSDLAY